MGAGRDEVDLGGGDFVLPLSPTTHVHTTGPIFVLPAGSSGQALEALFRHAGAARAAPRHPASHLRAFLLLALACVSLASLTQPRLRLGLEEALAAATFGGSSGPAPPPARDLDFPIQACCIGQQCVRNSRGRHAVVTHVRNQREVTQLQHLEASVRRSNPGVDMGVMLVRGELGAAATQRVMGLNVTVIYVEPLLPEDRGGASLQRGHDPHNWLKLRAFGLTQYDAVLLVEPGALLTGDIAPLFALPTDFAAGWDQARWLGGNASAVLRAVSGGGLFLRPCATTEAHMLDILRRERRAEAAAAAAGHGSGSGAAGLPLRQTLPQGAAAAEQEFLAWYFAYTGMALPFEVYVINMDGATARLASFQRTFEASDLKVKNFVRFPAVNGSALDASRLVSPRALADIEEAERRGYRTKHYQLTRGSVGCYMSHLQLYQHIAKTGAQFAFVFEDDVDITAPAGGLLAALLEAKPFPEDWDVVMLGHYCHDCPPLPGAPAFRRARSFFGTHAYVVHRRGLQKIFAYPHLMPIEKQIDAVLGDMCQRGLLNVYALAEPLVEQNEREFRSTIQIPVKRRIGVNPYSRERR
ncbi:hypothetical protein ABPG75_012135 [Micractinium tetrahymenae]